jgi:hypothetical protein
VPPALWNRGSEFSGLVARTQKGRNLPFWDFAAYCGSTLLFYPRTGEMNSPCGNSSQAMNLTRHQARLPEGSLKIVHSLCVGAVFAFL